MTHPLRRPDLTRHAVAAKSCYRCGKEFRTNERERVCWSCRKPKTDDRLTIKKELTFREKQIVDLVAQGKANKEIANHLFLTEGTIKEYLNRIFRKVCVSNRTELAVWSLTRKTVVPEREHESRPAFTHRSLIH